MAQHNSKGRPIAVTSGEPAERRHLVQPYSETPTVEYARGRAVCAWCANGSFRRSHLRATDLPRLLVLRYPVRCTRCGQRQFVSLGAAFQAYPPRSPLTPERGSALAHDWAAPVPATREQMLPDAPRPPVEAAPIAASQPVVQGPPVVTPPRSRDPHGIW